MVIDQPRFEKFASDLPSNGLMTSVGGAAGPCARTGDNPPLQSTRACKRIHLMGH
jgi:hypothetical protein